MKVAVATDAHVYKTPDGAYWTQNIYGYDFWKRYLEVFDTVRIIARVKEVESVAPEFIRVDGENAEVFCVPFYRGPRELLFRLPKIIRRMRTALDDCSVLICRIPSPTAHILYLTNKKRIKRMPFGLEVVYDASEAKGNGIVSKLAISATVRMMKKLTSVANGVAYVTSHNLPNHFPSKARMDGESEKHFETIYSSVSLDDRFFMKPRSYADKTEFTILHIDAAMNTNRKGEYELLQIIARLNEIGADVNGIFIGDGTIRNDFIAYSEKIGVRNKVDFPGNCSIERVISVLEQADLFVMPSQSEGLPRALLEAMASGLPCIASPVGGIPEVLGNDDMIAFSDIDAYVERIYELFNDPKQMESISERNITIAKNYHEGVLCERRNDFYIKLRSLCK